MIAFFTEQGPFKPNANLTLSLNPYAWNKIANMVFIESPAEVGFSYSDNEDDKVAGDDSTAKDNYALIQAFFTRFPSYRSNKLYLSSESYGGHYIPTLAKVIVDNNKLPTTVNPALNLVGFAVGNPYTNIYSGTPASIETFWGHQIIPKPYYDYYKALCTADHNSGACISVIDQLYEAIGHISPYALDFPVCLTDDVKYDTQHQQDTMQTNKLRTRDVKITTNNMLQDDLNSKDLNKGGRRNFAGSSAQELWMMNHIFSRGGPTKRAIMKSIPTTEEYQPCIDNWTTAYLNQVVVKKAIHVKEDIVWDECSRLVLNQSMIVVNDLLIVVVRIYNYY